jgi:serine/threonine protein kinase
LRGLSAGIDAVTARKGTEKTTPLAAQLVQIDRICDEFEARWLAGERPEIEEYLDRARSADRGKLFADLLEIELEMRVKGGDDFALADYQNRFVDYLQSVDSIYNRIVGRRRLGDYELLEELGCGGMGVVYRGRHVLLGQIVALKVLPSHVLDNPEALARFKREMKSLGRLSHRNVVRAYNAGEADGVYFLVMEYVDGMDLHRLVRSRIESGQGPLGVGAACEAVRQAALGLGHAHEQGLVHRDIKPANLMLSRTGEVRLLDLGLSKIRAERQDQLRSEQSGPLTQAGTTLGTVDYMAPEQWESSSRVDIRADIYSLGCTLFFLLSGRPPYGDAEHESIYKKLMAHAVESPPPLSDVCPGCPPKLVRVLGRMVAKKPDDRFATPNELADAIGEFADPTSLTECITGGERVDESAVASKPGITSSQIDTHVKQSTPAADARHDPQQSFEQALPGSTALPPSSNSLALPATLENQPELESEAGAQAMGVGQATAKSRSKTLRRRVAVALAAISLVVVGVLVAIRIFKPPERPPTAGLVDDSISAKGAISNAKRSEERPLSAGSVDDPVVAKNDIRTSKPPEGRPPTPGSSGDPVDKGAIGNSKSPDKRLPTARSYNDPVLAPRTGAYDLYKKALAKLAQREQSQVKQAVEYLNDAIDLAGPSALAYTARANANILYGDYAWKEAKDCFPMAITDATEATRLNPELAEAHLALAVATYTYNLNWRSAKDSFDQALYLNPDSAAVHHWYAWFLLQWKGRDELKRALKHIKEAHQQARLDPIMDPIILCNIGKINYYGHDYDEAVKKYLEAIHENPRFPKTRIDLALAYAELKQPDEAITQLNMVGSGLAEDDRDTIAARAYVFAKNDRRDDARPLLTLLEGWAGQKPLAYEIATIYSALNEKEKAFEWLERAFREQSAWRAYIKVDPKLDGLRDDNRFLKYVIEANLSE